MVSVINAEDYAREIRDCFLRRELIEVGETIINDAFDRDLDAPATSQIEKAESQLFNLAEDGASEGGFVEFKTALVNSISMVEAAYKREGGLAGLSTGLIDIDNLLGGLHPSDLLILAARPAMGKTALATNIAFHAATAGLDDPTQPR